MLAMHFENYGKCFLHATQCSPHLCPVWCKHWCYFQSIDTLWKILLSWKYIPYSYYYMYFSQISCLRVMIHSHLERLPDSRYFQPVFKKHVVPSRHTKWFKWLIFFNVIFQIICHTCCCLCTSLKSPPGQDKHSRFFVAV